MKVRILEYNFWAIFMHSKTENLWWNFWLVLVNSTLCLGMALYWEAVQWPLALRCNTWHVTSLSWMSTVPLHHDIRSMYHDIGRLHGRSLVQIIFQKKCKCMEYNTNHLLNWVILIEVYALCICISSQNFTSDSVSGTLQIIGIDPGGDGGIYPSNIWQGGGWPM